MEIDLHGYSPSDINGEEVLEIILKQAWETGAPSLTLIHGHGRNRGISPGFVNTNTGYLGLIIRRKLRNNKNLRHWVFCSTVDCKQRGATTVKMKPNPNPSRTSVDEGTFPPKSYSS